MTDQPDRPCVAIHDLTVRPGGRASLTIREFEVHPGEVVHVTGPNGIGKTTLLRALAGELPAQGDIRVCGAAPGSAVARTATTWVPTDAPLPDDLTVGEYLTFSAALWSEPPTHVLALAHVLGLDAWLDAWPDELSRGTRQKVALSAALGLARPLTLLDEPFGTLDHAARAALLSALRERTEAGGAVVLTTHGDDVSGLPVRRVALQGTLEPA